MLPGFRQLRARLTDFRKLDSRLDLLKSRVDCAPHLFAELEAERLTGQYRLRHDSRLRHSRRPDPLVSVCIATYNRAELLCDRAIRSIIDNTWQNIEIIVVGDHCTDDTEQRVAAIGDDRIKFVNLPQRGVYPVDPQRRWCVAGTVPLNAALSMATGDFVTHLDDDDAYSPFRIEKLLTHLLENNLEAVFHPFRAEKPNGWQVNKAEEWAYGKVTTSSILYDRFFARIPWDIDAHLLGEPGDWNRLRKFSYLGARIGRCPDVLLDHYREKNQSDTHAEPLQNTGATTAPPPVSAPR